MEAYRSRAAEEVQRCISTRPVFMDLDNQVTPLLFGRHSSRGWLIMEGLQTPECVGTQAARVVK